MDEASLRKLDYPKILKMLAEEASWEGGRERAMALQPTADFEEVVRRHEETEQARTLLKVHPSFSLGVKADVRGFVEKAGRGGVLEGRELAAVASCMAAFASARSALEKHRDAGLDLLLRLFKGIQLASSVRDEIMRCITQEGGIRDDATAELRAVRRRRPGISAAVRSKLESVIKGKYSTYVRETIITMRNGRYVIPVRQEHSANVPGLVHDQSSSGSTLFVEPLEVVELNNEIKKLDLLEQREVERVLTELSRLVAANAKEISDQLDALGRLDFALAKARLAERMDAQRPCLSKDRVVDLRSARHPLLGKDAVPIDVRIGRDFHVMVITGPNTGGKTVCLKTVGLLCAMAQSGLQIPAAPSSEVGVFDAIFCDIGDEQSIEQSLSTFSSHMRNLVRFIRQSTPESLVLLDELGAGTDPMEGASLGRAILEEFAARGTRTIATTHFSELKTYAYSRPGVENASVEFDPVTLAPTYRLVIGVPGRSGAFEIAERLGLDEHIVARARSFMRTEDLQLEAVLRDLQEKREVLRVELERARTDAMEAERLRRAMEASAASDRERRAEAMRRSVEEARSIVRRAEAESRELLEKFKEALGEELARLREEAGRVGAGGAPLSEPGEDGDRRAAGAGMSDAAAAHAARVRARLGAMRRELSAKLWQHEEQGSPARAGVRRLSPEEVVSGKEVFVRSLGRVGTLVSASGMNPEDEALVQVGAVKIRTKVGDLFSAPQQERPARAASPAGESRIAHEKAREISLELDLRGLTADEALAKADKYLDDAVLAGVERVRIVHGKGTGALRRAIAQFLRGHRNVQSYRLGGPGEGGEGVTVVELGDAEAGSSPG